MSWETERLEKAKQIIEMYPQKRSALGPLLYLAQDKDGYISNESIVEISGLIGITEVQVQSVASCFIRYY
ncbi:NAD(P)H-dependent oxidoreductase subunit E [Acidimicrobiia bacterium]|nr:NAD(P)H-dependent oxidoreductase subunit E [Acidimicrobiia bacterium]